MAAIILGFAVGAAYLEFRAIRHLLRAAAPEVTAVQLPRPEASLEVRIAGAADEIAHLLDLQACWFEPFPFDALLPRIERGRIVLPTAEPGVAPCADTGVELPVRLNGLTLGRFVLQPRGPTVGVVFPPTARDQAIAMAARLGARLGAALINDGSPPS